MDAGLLQDSAEWPVLLENAGLDVGRKQIHYDYMSKVLDVYKQALSPPRYETVIGSAYT